MKFLSVAALASMAVAAPAGEKSAPTPLDVKFEMVGNSEVKATISNNGKNNLKVFKTGTIFDSSNIAKVKVTGAKEPEFRGIRQRISTSNVHPDSFQHIAAGESVEVTFDVAEVYDLSEGGNYKIESSGAWSFAKENSNELVGSVPFQSNTVETAVDGAQAASVLSAFHDNRKRTNVQSDCTGSRGQATSAALSNCRRLASAAQQAASSGSASKIEEYFKGSDSQTRSTVAGVFSRAGQECGSTNSGNSDYYCTDVSGYCQPNVLAYTVPSQSYMAYCDIYFSDLPGLTNRCHAQDQATTTLHEMTHLQSVGGTDDLGYGYNNAVRLSRSQALNNADSYALYANAIYSGC